MCSTRLMTCASHDDLMTCASQNKHDDVCANSVPESYFVIQL